MWNIIAIGNNCKFKYLYTQDLNGQKDKLIDLEIVVCKKVWGLYLFSESQVVDFYKTPNILNVEYITCKNENVSSRSNGVILRLFWIISLHIGKIYHPVSTH